MRKQFMLDIETTGVDYKIDEVLQIALVEMNFKSEGVWEKGRQFNFFQHTDREPEEKFAKEHMSGLFHRCQSLDRTPVEEVRQQILDFFKSCNAVPPNVYICGWNVGIFDIPFLDYHGYLKLAKYVGGKLTGDCHYRTYEINGALQFVANLKDKLEINALINEALMRCPVPEGQLHDALYDCERQIHILNGLLKIIKVELDRGCK